MRLSMQDVVELLECSATDLPKQNGTYEQNCAEVEQFRAWLKRQQRTLAKRHHPDIGGDGERMKRINQLVDALIALEPARPMPVVYGWSVHVVVSGGANTTYTTSSSVMW